MQIYFKICLQFKGEEMRVFIIIMAMVGMLVANDVFQPISDNTDIRFQEILDDIRRRDNAGSKPVDISNLKECQNEQDKIEGCVERKNNFGGYTEEYLKNGKTNGGKVYYNNRQLALEYSMKDEKFHGAVKRYDKNGKLIYEAEFRNDDLITVRCRNGKKIPCVKIGMDIMLTLVVAEEISVDEVCQ